MQTEKSEKEIDNQKERERKQNSEEKVRERQATEGQIGNFTNV